MLDLRIGLAVWTVFTILALATAEYVYQGL